jgi:hypothetical protein
MSVFTATCPRCYGRGKVERAVWPDMPTPMRVSQAVPKLETFRRVTETCAQCDGAGSIARTEPVPVMQSGRRVGSVPATFDPTKIKSTNWLYDVRPGDFVRDGDTWIANRTLGPGDLEAVPGFVWDRE